MLKKPGVAPRLLTIKPLKSGAFQKVLELARGAARKLFPDMKKRINRVKLQIVGTETQVEFEVSHAERILYMPNSGWALPENSKFIFDNSNGIRFKPNKRNS